MVFKKNCENMPVNAEYTLSFDPYSLGHATSFFFPLFYLVLSIYLLVSSIYLTFKVKYQCKWEQREIHMLSISRAVVKKTRGYTVFLPEGIRNPEGNPEKSRRYSESPYILHCISAFYILFNLEENVQNFPLTDLSFHNSLFKINVQITECIDNSISSNRNLTKTNSINL